MSDTPPKFIFADCDPTASRENRWVFYRTRQDQRANRPDLRPIKLRISLIPTRRKASAGAGKKLKGGSRE